MYFLGQQNKKGGPFSAQNVCFHMGTTILCATHESSGWKTPLGMASALVVQSSYLRHTVLNVHHTPTIALSAPH
jgi:hypothetical protein